MRVRCQAERAVGEREDRAAVAAAVEVEMARVDRHRDLRAPRAAGAHGDAELRAQAVARRERGDPLRASSRRRRDLRGAERSPAPDRRRRASASCDRVHGAPMPGSRCASSAASSSWIPDPSCALTTMHCGLHSPSARRAAQGQHVAHLARGLRGERQVALADREDVGDLERAGLDRLHVVAEAGRADDDARVGERDDASSRTGRCRRSRRSRGRSRGIEAVDRGARRARQAAELAACRERADEDVLVRRRSRPCGCGRRGRRRR